MTKSAAGPGRPVSFDRGDVLERLVFVFWKHGYERSSYADIRRASGLSGSSLQHAFGTKYDIFVAALEHYYGMTEDLIAPLTRGAGLDAVIDWFAFIRAKIEQRRVPGGCLLVNTMSQPIGQEPEVQRCTSQYSERTRRLIARAFREGGMADAVVPSRVALVESAYLGIFTTNRTEPAPARALSMIDSVIELLESWKLS